MTSVLSDLPATFTEFRRRSARFRATLAAYSALASQGGQEPADGLVWLRFDDRPFAAGDVITPTGYLPQQWLDLYLRGQLRLDRVYLVRAAGPDRVSRATWNDPQRWCYQVDPHGPLEPDPDPTHNFMISKMCRSATVRRILREPQVR